MTTQGREEFKIFGESMTILLSLQKEKSLGLPRDRAG